MSLPKQKYTLRFIDTETGGLDAKNNSLLTVGLLSFYPGISEPEGKLYKISQPDYNYTLKAMEINKIDLDELRKEGLPAQEVALLLSNLPATENDVYIGHNVQFDFRFLENFVASHGYVLPRLERSHIDTKAMALNRMVNGRMPKMSTSLDVLCPYFGISNDNAHEALTDCIRTARLYEALLSI